MKNRFISVVVLGSIIITAVLGIVYSYLGFYYYFKPQDFEAFDFSNLLFLSLALVALINFLFMFIFFLLVVQQIELLKSRPIVKTSFLVILWSLSGFITLIFVVLTLFPIEIRVIISLVFITLGIFFFILQAYQGIEKLVYSLSTLLLGHRKFGEELDLSNEENTIKRTDHFFLFFVGTVFLILQEIVFLPLLTDLFSVIIPQIRELLISMKIEWLVDLIIIPFFNVVHFISDYLLILLLSYIDIEFLTNLSQITRLFTATIVLLAFAIPTIQESWSLWFTDIQQTSETFKQMLEETESLKDTGSIRGKFVHNPVFKVLNEGRVFLACFGRVTFTFIISMFLLYDITEQKIALMDVIETGTSVIIALIIVILSIKRLIFK